MNDHDIKIILDQLYAVDPSLKPRERELVSIIRALAIKPKAEYDPHFAAELRSRLLAELAANPPQKNPPRTLAGILAAHRFRFAFAGALAVVAALAASFAIYNAGRNDNGGPVALLSPSVSISRVGSNAFGTFSPADATSKTNGPAAPTSPSAGASPAAMQPMSAVANPTIMRVPPAPPTEAMTSYAYTGAPFTQSSAQLDVLKQSTKPISAGSAIAALEQAGFGEADLSAFGNLTLGNATFDESTSFGYEISIDFKAGTVSIGENYAEWPQGAVQPLTASDTLPDAHVIAIANAFLSQYHIPLSAYGAPSVTKPSYAVPMAEGPMIPYYSDSEEVVYPLIINGMPVYDMGGNPVGMNVTVNMRYGRVSEVYGLQTQNYEASAYDAITNTSTILSMAEHPVTYPQIYNGTISSPAGNSPAGELGTPSLCYVQTYKTDADEMSQEYLVPAFAFPFTQNGTAARKIIVPLIAEFVQNNNPPVIVPLRGAAQ